MQKPKKNLLNLSTKLFINFFHTIVNLYWSIQLFNTTFPPNLSTDLLNLILPTTFFPHSFQQHFSPTPFSQFSHPTLPTNFPQNLFTKIFNIILYQVFQLFCHSFAISFENFINTSVFLLKFSFLLYAVYRITYTV